MCMQVLQVSLGLRQFSARLEATRATIAGQVLPEVYLRILVI